MIEESWPRMKMTRRQLRAKILLTKDQIVPFAIASSERK